MRAVLALVASIAAGGLTLVLAVAAMSLIDDPSPLEAEYFVAYVLVGAVIGAVAARVARRTPTASIVAVGAVLLLHSVDIPDTLTHVARMLATLVAAGVGVACVRRLRIRERSDVDAP